MANASATLNGITVTDARLTIPAWGASYHDVALDSEQTITGAVTLVVADLTIKGTVLSGGPGVGRSFFRIVAGAGGWGKSIPRKGYQNDAGVKLATVLNDAATAAGETIDQTTINPTATVGPFFVRPAGPACRVLEMLAPQAWYVGEDGITRLGARAATTLTGAATRTTQQDQARGTLTLASDSIAAILPGVTVDGLTAVDVEHEINVKNGLRSKLWGKQFSGTSRRLSAWRALFSQLFPDLPFSGVYEYRVVTQNVNRLNLQAVRVSKGMPDLANVPMRPGVAGVNMKPALGSRVLVAFVDADPSRPAVVSFEDPDSPGFLATQLQIGSVSGGLSAARQGDSVSVTFTALEAGNLQAPSGGGPCTAPGGSFTLTGTITSGSVGVKIGN